MTSETGGSAKVLFLPAGGVKKRIVHSVRVSLFQSYSKGRFVTGLTLFEG
jgi:hypothetical protein